MAKTVAKPPVPAAAKKVAEAQRNQQPLKKKPMKTKNTRTESYARYIFKVFRYIHPEMSISKRAMSILESLMTDIFERFAREAGLLVKYSKKSTISTREMQTAVRLILPGELAKHAISEATKAIAMYEGSRSAN